MNITCKAILAAVLVTAAPICANAQSADRTIEQFTCKDVLRDAGAARDIAIAFLHGYLLGKSNTSKFNLEAIAKQTDMFIERCLDNPSEKAQDVMTKVKS